MTITKISDREIALMAERDALHQQLAEAQALIEAIRKQEAVAFLEMKYEGGHEYLAETYEGATNSFPVFAAPVVALDVLKEIERKNEALLNIARKAEALKKECGDDPESPQAIRNGRYMHISYLARAAMGGAA